jgi:hypothetical protein
MLNHNKWCSTCHLVLIFPMPFQFKYTIRLSYIKDFVLLLLLLAGSEIQFKNIKLAIKL